MWRVAGTTEPQRAMRGVGIVRFCVPVLLDDVSGADKFRKVSLALYRVPENDDADDVYIAADENLPRDRRPAVTSERLDDMEYLGEARVHLQELQLAAQASGGGGGGGFSLAGSRQLSAFQPISSVGGPRSRCQFALTRGKVRGVVGEPGVRPPNPENDASRSAAIEALVATPSCWPRPGPRDAGRFIADVVVTFAPVRSPVEAVYVRLLRWVGDGFQPVYSTLITSSEVPTRPTPVVAATTGGGARSAAGPVRRWKVRVPTMHIPVACLGGGEGGFSLENTRSLSASQPTSDGGHASQSIREQHVSSSSQYLPRSDTPWRLEIVARMQSGHDVLLGWLDTSLAALDEAGRCASKDTPASFECDVARGESDFECVHLNAKEGECPPTIGFERWILKPGSNGRAAAKRRTASAEEPRSSEVVSAAASGWTGGTSSSPCSQSVGGIGEETWDTSAPATASCWTGGAGSAPRSQSACEP